MEIKQKSWIVPFMWLHAVLWFAPFYPLAADILYLGPEGTVRFTSLALILLIPVALSWYLIRKTRAFWQYLPLAVLLCALSGALAGFACSCLVPGVDPAAQLLARERLGVDYTGFLDGITGTLIAAVASYLTSTLSIAVCMVRVYARIRKGRLIRILRQMPQDGQNEIFQKGWELPTYLDMARPKQWIWYGLHYLLALMLENETYSRIVFWLLFADILLSLLGTFTERVRAYIRDHQQIANLPAETILRLRWIILCLAMLCLLLFMLPSALYGREPLQGAVIRMKEAGARKAGSAVPEPEPTPEPAFMDIDFSGLMAAGRFLPPKWLTDFLNLFAKALEYVLLAFIFYHLFRLVLRAVLDSSRSFQVKEEDEVIYIKKKEEENPALLARVAGQNGLFSPNMRIRRHYRRVIRRAGRDLPRGHETPTELESAAGLSRTPEVELLHYYYEKARYSEEGCSRDEVENLRRKK